MTKKNARSVRLHETYPPVALPSGHRVHLFFDRNVWEVWLQPEFADLDGVLLSVSTLRRGATNDAIAALRAALRELRKLAATP